MVLAGKDPMYCLSGKLRFISQIIIVRRLIFEGIIIILSSEISSTCSGRFNVVSSYVPNLRKLFLVRLSFTCSYHLWKVCYHYFIHFHIFKLMCQSSQAKWLLQISIIMTLPHGLDGGGPEVIQKK